MYAHQATKETQKQKVPEVGSIIRLKEFSGKDYQKQLYVIESNQETVREIEFNEQVAFDSFITNHYNKSKEDIDIVIKVHDCRFVFKQNYFVYFKRYGDELWSTIIVSSKKIIECFWNGKLYSSGTNPYLLHGMIRHMADEQKMARRSISTYGCIKHEPQIESYDFYSNMYSGGSNYVVVGHSCTVPNQKPRFKGVNEDSIFLHVEPTKGLQHNEEIFWYVDFNKKFICQFEDGAPTYELESIEVL